MSVALSQDPSAAAPNSHDRRRMHVLAAARACFARAGFHGASVGQICAEAGMSPGALYRYFPSKDAIIEAIADEERIQAGACMAEMAGEEPLVDRMAAAAMTYLRDSLNPDTGGLMVEIWSESIRNTAVGRRFHAVEGEVRQALREALARARETGEVDPGLDLDAAMTVLFAVVDGLAMRLQLGAGADLGRIETYLKRAMAGLLQPPQRS